MNKTILFHDNSKIILNEKGNTYIGEYAHKVMYCYWEALHTIKLGEKTITETFFNEIVKQGKGIFSI